MTPTLCAEAGILSSAETAAAGLVSPKCPRSDFEGAYGNAAFRVEFAPE